MRILFLTSSKNASGGGRQALYLASGMKERGHETVFFSPPGSQLRDLGDLASGVAWRDLPPRRRDWRAAMEDWIGDEPAIAHAFHNKAVKSLALCGTLWRVLRKPVACVAHRGVIYRPRNVLPYIAPGIRVFAVNSQACLKTLPLLWRRKAGVVVYNGVPDVKITPTRSPEEVRAELGVETSDTVIGCVSNNAPVKGLEYLLRAFAAIARPGLVLCLVGGREDFWGDLCTRLGIRSRVRLIPRTEQVADYVQTFSLFVLPSLSESSPNTLQEAMRMGLPAVATKVGGVPECLDDPRWLVPPADPDALANAIAAALDDTNALAAAAARNLAFSEHFSLRRKLDVMEAIYGELLKAFY